jgi:hypothetical protein
MIWNSRRRLDSEIDSEGSMRSTIGVVVRPTPGWFQVSLKPICSLEAPPESQLASVIWKSSLIWLRISASVP